MTKQHEEYIRQRIRETDNDTVAMGLELYLFMEQNVIDNNKQHEDEHE